MWPYQNYEHTIAWKMDLSERLKADLNKSKDSADNWEGYKRVDDQEARLTFIRTLFFKDSKYKYRDKFTPTTDPRIWIHQDSIYMSQYTPTVAPWIQLYQDCKYMNQNSKKSRS